MPPPAAPARPGRRFRRRPARSAPALAHPVATVRWLWLAYMTPGRPGRSTTETELRWIYTAWLGAFLLKMLGSSWDVSWHFRWLRDDLAPPHLLNSAGTAVVIGLVVFHSYSGYGVDRRALRLMQWGIGHVPDRHPDRHRQPPDQRPGHHQLEPQPRAALPRDGDHARRRDPRLVALRRARAGCATWSRWACGCSSSRTCSSPTSTRSTASCRCATTAPGTPPPSRRCWTSPRAQGQTPTQFMLPVPSWVHPTWLVCAGLLALVVARKVVGLRWTATTIAGAYLAYRGVMWLLLVGLGFPPSVLPFVLLVGAVLVDLAVTSRVPGLGRRAGRRRRSSTRSAVGQEALGLLPPWNWWSVLPVAVGFGLLWTGVDLLERSRWLDRWKAPVEPGAGGGSAPRPDPTAHRRGTPEAAAADDVASDAGAGAGRPPREARVPRRQAPAAETTRRPRPARRTPDVLALTPAPLQTAGERALFHELTRWDTGGSVRAAVVASIPLVDGPHGAPALRRRPVRARGRRRRPDRRGRPPVRRRHREARGRRGRSGPRASPARSCSSPVAAPARSTG